MASGNSKTFSESWYRVAQQKLALRSQVQVQRQFYRGRKWYVLRDPFTNQFYRLRPAAYEFVSRLNRQRTIESVWQECLHLNPDHAPGQEEIIHLLAQLYHTNLLQYESSPDSRRLFERYRKSQQKEHKAKLLSIMFARFPLFDPDHFLKRFMPLARLLISPLGALIWLAVVGWGLKIAADNFSLLRQQSQGILAPGNLLLLYAALVIIKTVHEFGHSFVCRRYGGEVHTMGIMLLLFTPIPYMDATSAWAFRNRWQRVLVGAAGMLVEIFLAACAALVWAHTGPGTLHSLAYNMMFIASVSTVIFNINPLLRFDGYYILSDLVDFPNLHTQTTQHLTHLVERYAFGCKSSRSPAHSLGDGIFLTLFGIASWIYRIIVFSGILLVVADKYLLAGILMLAGCLVSWVLVPIGRMFRYLTSSPKLARTRVRAILVTTGTLAATIILLGLTPYPDRFRAPGVVESLGFVEVINESPGTLTAILAETGGHVAAGQPILQLQNRELTSLIASVRAQIEEGEARFRQAMDRQPADQKPLRQQLNTLQDQLGHLLQQQKRLTITAAKCGIWNAPEIHNLVGMWIPRGMSLGNIINPKSFCFTAVVFQQEATRLFAQKINQCSVRLFGEADTMLPIQTWSVIPAQQEILPSAALGWGAGGEIPIDRTDPGGRRSLEPFFIVRCQLDPAEQLQLRHGRTGKLRLELAPRPILQQWFRKFRQLLQKRYQI
jgi:putative peptide zinc metalloprotease protein